MRKIFNFVLIAMLSAPVYANHWGGSVRGDVGMLGSQVPYLIFETGITPASESKSTTRLSHRKGGLWDFTGRLFMYTSCRPCSTYIAGSWQGSNHKVHSCFEGINDPNADTTAVLIPLRVVVPYNFNTDTLIGLERNGQPVLAKIEVKNKFSKAKLGLGIDLIKNSCFHFTMEVGANYLNAQLETDQNIIITQTVEQGSGCISVPPGHFICSPVADELPFDYLVNNNICQKTEGVGLYANFRADYKLPANCLGNCFSLYAKAELADIIGRQKYNNTVCYSDEFSSRRQGFVSLASEEVFDYDEHLCNRYTNIVEVDLEAALVYSPCFKGCNNLNLNFALGARTDSFVNLFSKPSSFTNISYLNLTRPTVFLEVGMKI